MWAAVVLWMAVMTFGLLAEVLFEKRYLAFVGSAAAGLTLILAARYSFWLTVRALSPERMALYVEDGRLVHLHRRFWSIDLGRIHSVEAIQVSKGGPIIEINAREGRGHNVRTDLLREKITPTIAAIQAARRAASHGMA